MARDHVRVVVKKNRLDSLGPEMQAKVSKAIEDTAQDILAEAKGRVPGVRLPKTFGVRRPKALKRVVFVGSRRSFHAGFLEYGSTTQAAQPFMTPAAEWQRLPFQRKVQAIVDEL